MKALRAILLAGVFLLPLACWPLGEDAFSGPKLALAVLLAAVVIVRLLFEPKRSMRAVSGAGWLWYAWLGTVGLAAMFGSDVNLVALVLALVPIPLYAAASEELLPGEQLMRVLLAASVAESAIVVLQFLGHDPLAWFGWQAERYASARMQCYGTFGNPNFVAAWLVGTLPLYVRVIGSGSRGWWAAAALQVCALVACGSRAPVLGLAAAAIVFMTAGGAPRKWLMGAAAICALLAGLSQARPLAETIRGRAALARVTAEHLLETPPTGYGPGAFVVKYSEWQLGWLRSQHAPRSRRFAGPLDHAHNDYLEFWVDYGPLGLAAFLALAAWIAAGAVRKAPACVAGAAALAAVALVDFPFHRPGEWVLFWLLLGVSASRSGPETGAHQKGHGEDVTHC